MSIESIIIPIAAVTGVALRSLLAKNQAQSPQVVKDLKQKSNPIQHITASDFDNFISNLDNYRRNNCNFEFVVGIDVGATNTRTALFLKNLDTNVTKALEVKFQCKSMNVFRGNYAKLGDRVYDVLRKVPLGSVVALAGPVVDHTSVALTNYVEKEQDLHVDELNEKLFPRGKTRFINDLEAACFGIIGLGLEDRLGEYMASLWVSNEESSIPVKLKKISYAVMSMGTGLGVGIIQYNDNYHGEIKYQPLPLEAGHCLIAHPAPGDKYYDRDIQRLKFLSKKLYKDVTSIEYEDICSGRGLQYCHEFELSLLSTNDEPKIATRALKSGNPDDTPEGRALLVHYKYLMEAAQNVCVMIPSVKGVFFTGDNQLANESFVLESADIYKEVFLNHPKRHWLEPVAKHMVRQKTPHNFNLEGAHFVANHLN
ncbi:glucokinase [Acrasis kona]|uniref:Glucokinase n=1 Tax=Acrasis kona TaxID=1008807 RepID=A0AAW2YXX5_9EUKA